MSIFDRFTKQKPLIDAVVGNNVRSVKDNIKRGVNINAPVEESTGRCAIHYASAWNYDVLAVLLSNGANVDIRDHEGNTALHVAAVNGFYDGVALLLKHGADVNPRNKIGETPLSRLQNKLSPTQGFFQMLGVPLDEHDKKQIEGKMRVEELLKKNGAIL